MTNNNKTVNVKITRGELCDLLLACWAAEERSNDGGVKWTNLHDKLMDILDDFDEKNT